MSSTWGNCDFADKTQCVKKANQYGVVIVDTESNETEVLEFSAAAENKATASAVPTEPVLTATVAIE